jgi:peptidoglycan/xylan/chitin deacetylase (PgdA/CDA1 family)
MLSCTTAGVERESAAAMAAVPQFQVARWYEFRSAACSLTFDDGTLDQYLVAFPELQTRNLRATFFLITGPREEGWWDDNGTPRRLFGWEEARKMAFAGHEIASHSVAHTDLTLEGAPVERELTQSRRKLEDEVRFRHGLVFGWPYWRSTAQGRRLASRHYVAARSGGAFAQGYLGDSAPGQTPRDFYDIDSLGALRSAENAEWLRVSERVIGNGGWLVAGFHGIDDGRVDPDALGWEALPLARFREVLDYVRAEDYWIAPFGRVVRYIRERDRAKTVLLQRWPWRVVLTLDDGLDDVIYDQALTIRMKLPLDWRHAEVRQGEAIMKSRRSADGVLVFDAFPTGGLIVVTRVPRFPPSLH